MKSIKGNTAATFQVPTYAENAIGEKTPSGWTNAQTIKDGVFDLSGGSSGYTSFNAKIQESTHIFVCNYEKLNSKIKAENSRALINGKVYDVMLIDDPMGMHAQLEIYLKYTGGQ